MIALLGSGVLLDRGSQYCAQAYQATLCQFGMIPSKSRKGNCADNAPMERCWGMMKHELVHHRRYSTREQARREIMEYIEVFYNRPAAAFPAEESLARYVCPVRGPSTVGGVRLQLMASTIDNLGHFLLQFISWTENTTGEINDPFIEHPSRWSQGIGNIPPYSIRPLYRISSRHARIVLVPSTIMPLYSQVAFLT